MLPHGFLLHPDARTEARTLVPVAATDAVSCGSNGISSGWLFFRFSRMACYLDGVGSPRGFRTAVL